MIPSGYKNQKVYSVKPLDGSGDLTFSRASSATRVASNGLIEKVRTNLYPNGSALLSTGWTSVGATLTAGQTDPNGGTTALRVQLAAAQSPYAYILQSFTGSAATYARSVFIKGATAQSIRIVDPHSGVGSTINLTTSYQRFTAVGAGIAPSFGIQFDNDNDDLAKDFTIAFVQIEEGDIATDYIATTTAAVSVGPVSGLPRLDYLGSTCGKLLLEPQRTNLLQYSEQLNNAWWTPDGGTITANTAVAPDGTTSMDRLTETATTNPHQVISTAVTIFGGAARTFSAFVKKGNVRYIQIANVAFGTSSASSIFDLDTKTVTANRASSGAGPAFGFVNSYIEDYGNGILRLVLVNTCSFDAPTYRIAHSNQATFTGATLVDGMVSYAGNASSFTDIWGCQLESASYATSYIPTLGASITRVADAASKTGISSLIGQTEGTIFGELKITAYDPNGFIPVYLKNSAGSNEVYVWFQTDGRIRGRVYNASAAQADIFTAAGFATVGGTYKFALAYKQNDFAFYVNGQQIGTDTSGTVGATSEFYFTYAQLADFSFPLNINQALIFPTRLTNAQLAELTTL